MRSLRFLLFPFSLLYGAGVIVRNLAFDLGLLKSHAYDFPVISVGNLSVGGAGKSPVTEYLVRLLKDSYKIATLSRGYGRKSKGFLLVGKNDLTMQVGDEPLQFKRKFDDVTVAVCERRADGINRLLPDHDLVVLDDAYQHRAVNPGMNILLFDYNTVFGFNMLLPAGDLREPLWEKDRADIILITKTPAILTHTERQEILNVVRPRETQEVFYSYLQYGDLEPINDGFTLRTRFSVGPSTKIVLLTGIANPAPLLSELRGYSQHIDHHNYPDHHQFTKKNILKLVKSYESLAGDDKLVITTEKDAQRLDAPGIREHLSGLPVYYLPVKAEIHEPDKAQFDQFIKNYAAELRINN